MLNNMAQFTQTIQQNGGGHILYFSNCEGEYVANAADYIVTGIKNGHHIVFVENDRIILKIAEKLFRRLTVQELKRIQFINNFDFYFSNGNFHPVTIFNHFFDTLDPYYEQGLSLRLWGHVEWGPQNEIERTLESFEREVDQLMPDMEVIAVCAYESDRLSYKLKKELMKCHGYLMTDHYALLIPEMELASAVEDAMDWTPEK
ncbi:MEDS domain-containing protein [Peribacillus sp. SCS-155]|uniref:MEDS domain-containing protein n=1 Tax=Peribacillus sedimenti TaxID=3115297 RepID=UPI0039058FA4